MSEFVVFATDVRTYGPDRLRAHCTCGWEGKPYRDGRKAWREAEAHAVGPHATEVKP